MSSACRAGDRKTAVTAKITKDFLHRELGKYRKSRLKLAYLDTAAEGLAYPEQSRHDSGDVQA